MGVLAETMAMETAVWIALVVSIVGIFAEIALGICLYVVAQRAKKVDTLESRLEENADEKIEAKFTAMENKLLLPINGLKTMLDETQRRLGRGDQHFDDLNERDQDIQIKLATRFGELQKWMLENFASKKDLESLGDRFDGLQRAVNVHESGRS